MSESPEVRVEERARAEQLLDLLALEPIERNLFRGKNEHRAGRLFGGQVLAQALSAAYATVSDRDPAVGAHSVHAYFLRAGDAARPVLYEVDRIRDGRSFVTRRVAAIQRGEAIFSASMFQSVSSRIRRISFINSLASSSFFVATKGSSCESN